MANSTVLRLHEKKQVQTGIAADGQLLPGFWLTCVGQGCSTQHPHSVPVSLLLASPNAKQQGIITVPSKACTSLQPCVKSKSTPS